MLYGNKKKVIASDFRHLIKFYIRFNHLQKKQISFGVLVLENAQLRY